MVNIASAELLKKFTRGKKYTSIRKAGTNGKTKTSWINSLMSNAAAHADLQEVIDKHNIDKSTDLSNPTIHSDLLKIIKKNANGEVSVTGVPPDTGTFKAGKAGKGGSKPTRARGNNISPSVISKLPNPTGQKQEPGKADLEFLKPILAHELKRFKNHGDTPVFSNYSNEPHQRAVEKQFVAGLEDKYHNARFEDLKTSGGGEKMILATGVLADMIFLQTGMAAAMGISPMNKHLTAAQKEELKNSSTMREVNDVMSKLNTRDLYAAQQNKAKQERDVNIQEGKLTKEMTKGLGMPDSTLGNVQDVYNQAIQSAYKKLVRQGHSPFDKSTMANAQMVAYDELYKALQNQPPNIRNNVPPSIIDQINIGITANKDKFQPGIHYDDVYDKMIRDARPNPNAKIGPDDTYNPPTGGKDPNIIDPHAPSDPKVLPPTGGAGGGGQKNPFGDNPIGGGGDVTKPLPGEGDGGKVRTRPGGQPVPGSGPGVQTEPIDKTEEKKKDKEREPDPPVEPKEKDKRKKKRDDDSDEDDDSDDEDKPIPVPPKENPDKKKFDKYTPYKSQLRPYFAVGGENALRISDKAKKQEIKDWNLYSFVPGYVNDSIDNPLTQHNHEQYQFRMQNTNPDAQFYRPRPYTGGRRYMNMRDVYQRNAPFFNQADPSQYQGRESLANQDRTEASPILAMSEQFNLYPDTMQVASQQIIKKKRIRATGIMLASKSIF